MDDMEELNAAEANTAKPPDRALIAPWWHTALTVALLLVISALGTVSATKRGFASHHLAQYSFSLVFEWVLAALALWGIWLRKVPLRQLLGLRRSGVKAWFTDLGVALTFWLMAMIILAAIRILLMLFHLMPQTKAVGDLAPRTSAEMFFWIALSVSAGICEELFFRGYLQQQFARIAGSVWMGVAASALLFGLGHGYQGASAMIAITAYGALFSILAIKWRSLRAGMMAHAWHDAITGIALAIAHAQHLI
jgi:membrane protease YdiL (CAAX protease family)